MAQDDTPPTREDPPDPAPAEGGGLGPEPRTWDPDALHTAGGFTPGPDAQALIATTQRYRPIAPIGQGGMGAVWRVEDTALGRTVALKLIRPDRRVQAAALEPRFREEAQVTAQLQHPAIVPVYDIGRLPDGALYYTMQEVDGEPLGGPIRRVHEASGDGPWKPGWEGWTWVRLVAVVRTVAEAVGLAHARGVLHRDLKPSNIVVGRHGQVFVLDWGLAKVLGAPDSAPPGVGAPVRTRRSGPDTMVGQVAGTWGYMPPEQARGDIEALSPASDVYALGAILYRLLTGRPPGDDPDARAQRLDQARARGRLPERLDQLVRACMADEPADRPPDGRALALALTAWLEGAQEAERTRGMVAAAEAALAALGPGPVAAADGVLARLLDAEGRAVPRDQARLAPTADAAQAVDALRDAGALVRSPEGEVALADAGLASEWPRLAALARDTEGRRLAARVAEAAAAWVARGRDPAWLARGEERAALDRWAAPRAAWLTDGERDWLQAGAEADAKAEARQRLRLQGAAVLALLVAGALGLLWWRAEGARAAEAEARLAAEAAEQRAQGRRLLAEGHAMLADSLTFEALALYRAAAELLPEDDEPTRWIRDIAAAGRAAHTLPVDHGRLARIRVSPDGAWVASLSRGGTVRVHALATGAQVAKLETGAWAGMTWTAAGTLAVAAESGAGFRIDPASGTVEGPFGGGQERLILDLRPSDGRAVLGEAGGLAFADAPDTRVSHPGTPSIGFYSPDGRHLVTLAMDAPVVVHDGRTLAPVATSPGGSGLKSVSFVGGGAMLVHRPPEATLVRFDAPHRTAGLAAVSGTAWSHKMVAADTAGTKAAGGDGPTLSVVDTRAEAPRLLWKDRPHAGDITALAFSPDGRWLASTGADGGIAVHDAATGAVLTRWFSDAAGVGGLDWTPDGRGLVTGGRDGRLQHWRPGLARLAGLLGCGGRPAGPGARGVHETAGQWVFSEGETLCRVDPRAPEGGVAWPGRWTGAGPGLDGRSVVALDAGRPTVLDLDGGRRPVPTPTPAATREIHADPAGGRWLLRPETDLELHRVTRAGERVGPWSVPFGDTVLLPRSRRAVVVPRMLGMRGLLLVDLDASAAEPWTVLLEDAPRVDLSVGFVADDTRGRLHVLGADGGIRTLDAADGAAADDLPEPLPDTVQITGSPDDRWLLAASQLPAIRAWRLGDAPSVAWTLPLPRTPRAASLLGAEGLAAVATADGTRIIDLETGQLRLRLPETERAEPLETGHVALAIRGGRGGVALWDVGDLDTDPAREAGSLTNLRVCPGSHDVVPVSPFPAADTVWAPPEACGG